MARATMGDWGKVGVHRAFDGCLLAAFSFIRRNRAFLFSNRVVQGRASFYPRPFNPARDDPVPERINLVKLGLLNSRNAAELAEWLWDEDPATRASDLCIECGKSAADGTSVPIMLPSVLCVRPDDQADAFPWVGRVHVGCQKESLLSRITQRESRNGMGDEFVRRWKLEKSVCRACSTPVTPTTLHDFHFDHRDPLRKSFDIGFVASFITKGDELAALVSEADKCDLICRACHYKHTGKQRRERVIFPGIDAERVAANEVLINDPDTAAQVLADLKEADVTLETERLYTRLFCANQETNCFGLSRQDFYQRTPTLPDKDCLRAVAEAQWDFMRGVTDAHRRKLELLHPATDTEEPTAKKHCVQ